MFSRKVVSFIFAILFVFVIAVPAFAETEKGEYPVDTYAYACGELVHLNEGVIQFKNTTSSNGLLRVQFTPQGVWGVGLTSGERYHGTGTTTYNFHWTKGQTLVSNYKNVFVVRSGSDGLRLFDEGHMTITPDGKMSVSHYKFTYECLGN